MTDTATADRASLPRVNADTLHRFVRALWQAAGSSEREAGLLADHLVAANLAGHDSHGVGMIPRYVRSLDEGALQLNRHARVVRDAGAVLTVDGELGFGQVVAHEAMALGIERALRLGVCAVGLRNAHHIGRIGHWAEQCAQAGLVSFHFVNVAGDPLVAPFGGIDSRIGTNPFCAAFPRDGRPPLVLDFATSAIAYGKTRVAWNQGAAVPPGCLIDHAGRPTDDPAVMHADPRGALLPAGGYKGYGLASMCEIFGGALTGGLTTHADTVVAGSTIVNGMLSVLLDPKAFDAADAQAQADAFVEWVKASPLADDAERILAPGEPEQATRADRLAHGIPLDRATAEQIASAARAAGMDEAAIAAFAGPGAPH